MQGTLFGIGKFDLSAFAAVGLILLTTALLACYLPAHRARIHRAHERPAQRVTNHPALTGLPR